MVADMLDRSVLNVDLDADHAEESLPQRLAQVFVQNAVELSPFVPVRGSVLESSHRVHLRESRLDFQVCFLATLHEKGGQNFS